MKVNYMNFDIHDDFVRVTFVGYDKQGRRRPVIDLSATDLATLVGTVRAFRARQKMIARRYVNRCDIITNAGVTE